MLKDFRYALRSLAQAPAFAIIAILTLGLGIGANTAIFSVVDAVLLRPLPYPQSDRLLAVREADHNFPSMSISYPDYLDWEKDNRSFSALAAYRGAGAVITHAGPPAVLNGQDCTWQYFPVLGIKPQRGRTFTAAEDHSGATPVAVISDHLWRTRFHADPQIVGKAIELDSVAHTIVGVMPPGFPGLAPEKEAAQFWVPLGAEATAQSGLLNRGSHPGLTALGRLKPGVTLVAARTDMARIARNLSQQFPKSNTGETAVVTTYLQRVVRNDGPQALWALLAAVGLVLLIACANVANLLLARAATRQKANAIRSALGASRGRLIHEHLIESLCLGIGGSALGLLLAWLAMRAAPALIAPQLGMMRADQMSLDWRVLGFTIALALLTTVLFGLAPAWHASNTELAAVLKQGGRETSAAGSGGRLRAVLVSVEMALALVLLVGAGLLIRSLLQLQRVNPGFNPDHVLSFGISLPSAKYPRPDQGIQFFHQARLHLERLPGVLAAGKVYPLPFSGNDWENSFTIVGRPTPPPGQTPSANYAMISGDYLQAMGMHLLRGRSFHENDTAQSTPVAIVDTLFARRYWPGPRPLDTALGKQFRMNGKTWTIVGIVQRVLDYGLDASTEMDRLPEAFVPTVQAGDANDGYLVVRTRLADPLQMRGAATAAIQSIDPDEPLYDMMTMRERIALSLAQRRLTLWLMGGFALLALILAAIGIYGVLSYAVAQRSHEIGLRMALGADRPRVLRLILRQGLRLAVAGAVAGLVVALVVGRFAASFLYGVSSHDPLTLVLVPLVLLLVAAAACYVPALRATRVDPMITLRGE
ncbi:MAG: ABC transporter permease [Acidobacteria bacterium]|nr:MAG: ABC transporter permease [Acidobacteriota bacterium]